jgi:tripartite-type tricarboxylate transporter receptor subunit TctC
MIKQYVFAIAASLAMALLIASANAQQYPSKQVRLIVPYAAGSGGDIIGRVFAQKLGQGWGQQVITDNRPGAGGGIGSEVVAKAAPDGHTLLLGASSSHAINVSLYSKLAYDPVKDFAPIALLVRAPNVLLAHPSLPVRNVKELIALAKARPGMLTYGSSGSGTSNHLSGELLKHMTKINIIHVPYKGSPQALSELMGGQISSVFAPMLTAMPHFKSGRVRPLAVTTAQRTAVAPELPTIAESGVPGYDSNAWFGLLAPAGMPRELVARLNKESLAILAQPDVTESLKQQGADPARPNTPEQFGAYILAEINKWRKIIQASGATPN